MFLDELVFNCVYRTCHDKKEVGVSKLQRKISVPEPGVSKINNFRREINTVLFNCWKLGGKQQVSPSIPSPN